MASYFLFDRLIHAGIGGFESGWAGLGSPQRYGTRAAHAQRGTTAVPHSLERFVIRLGRESQQRKNDPDPSRDAEHLEGPEFDSKDEHTSDDGDRD